MSEEPHAAFTSVSTATVTMALLKRGLRNVWLRGVRTLDPSAPRVVGRAFTMRFVPGREDLATPESLASLNSTRFAIERFLRIHRGGLLLRHCRRGRLRRHPVRADGSAWR